MPLENTADLCAKCSSLTFQSCELELKELALEYTRLGPARGGTQERLAVITVTTQKGVLTPATL